MYSYTETHYRRWESTEKSRSKKKERNKLLQTYPGDNMKSATDIKNTRKNATKEVKYTYASFIEKYDNKYESFIFSEPVCP